MSVTVQIRDVSHRVRELTLNKPISLLGRGVLCDARLRGDSVSARHAKLKLYQKYAIIEDLDSLNGVFVNGNRIQGEVQVTLGDQIEFGKGGPSLQIVQGFGGTVQTGPSSGVSSTVQHSASNSQYSESENRTRKQWLFATGCGIMLCLTILLIVGAALTGYFATAVLVPGSGRLNAEDIFENYSESILLVCFRIKDHPGVIPIGTAFAIQEDGLCATNAHVVIGMKELKQELESYLAANQKIGEVEVLLISPGGTHEYQVRETYVHQAYARQEDLFSPDVGLIQVKLTDNQSMKPVSLATKRNLRRLKKGEELCYIGYPVFDARRDYNRLKKIAPRTFRGNLIRMLNYQEESTSIDDSMVVEHSMDTVGGASGSPIFDRSEQVVALLFAGMMVVNKETGQLETEQRINYGIRVDALREVIEDYRQEHQE